MRPRASRTRGGPVAAAVVVALAMLGGTAIAADNAHILLFEDHAAIRSGIIVESVDGTAPVGMASPPVYVQRLTVLGPTFFGGSPRFSSSNALAGNFVLPPNKGLFATAVPIVHPNSGVSSNVWYWTGDDGTVGVGGVGDLDGTVPTQTLFEPLPAQVRVRSAKFNFLFTELRGLDSEVDLFSTTAAPGSPRVPLATTDAFGSMHQQIAVSVRGQNEPPPDGYYLIAMRMEMNGLISSRPIRLLLNARYLRGPNGILMEDGDPLFDPHNEARALAWVEDLMVPVPGTVALMAPIALLALTRRVAA